MYSGSDSTESLKNQKWPTLSALYPNTSNEQIDWAALAQQWIIMKEAGPPVPDLTPPSPPPPPNIRDHKKMNLSEGGEAPMEVENDKEDVGQALWDEDMPPTDSSWNWNQQQWSYSWTPPVQANIAPKAPLLPTPGTFNHYSTAPVDAPASFQYNTKAAATEYSGGYWTSSGNKSKPHNKRFSKVNLPQRHSAPATTPPPADPITLDANRRKQLPAWIRDGLEKMERDKLKQIEKEKEKLEPKGDEKKTKFNEKEALEIIKSTVKERERSKFDSEGDDSNNEVKRSRRKRSPEPVMISYEDLMLRIRRAMTEILLKVTNQEILVVCKEEYQRRLRKRKASDHRVSASSGTNLTGKLGLGIYGESESSSDEGASNSGHESVDSEAELKAVIRKRKTEFVKTEREIEERLAAAEIPASSCGRAGTPDTYESQVDAKYQDYRLKLGHTGVASSPKYNSLKYSMAKPSPSTSSSSDSDTSDKRTEKIIPNRSSNSESISSQKYGRYINREGNSQTPDRNVKEKQIHSVERKYSYSRSRRSRSKSNSSRRNSSISRNRYRDSKNTKTFSRRSRSRSSSQSTESNGRRSDSYSKNNRSRKSRSRSRSRRRQSNSSECSSRRGRKSGFRHKSRSLSPDDHYRRSRSSSRGKRSQRH